jgi:hypothetical protein
MVTNSSTSRTLRLTGETLSATAVVGASGEAMAKREQPPEQVHTAADGPAPECDEAADDQEFFWPSAVQDGPALPWRSLFR